MDADREVKMGLRRKDGIAACNCVPSQRSSLRPTDASAPTSLPPPFANMASAFPVPTAWQLPSAPPSPLPVPPRLPPLLLTLATTASAFPLPAACSDSSSRSRCSAASGTDARSRKEGRMPAACMAMPEASSVTCVRACRPQHQGAIGGVERS